jgi:hypothetical protein
VDRRRAPGHECANEGCLSAENEKSSSKSLSVRGPRLQNGCPQRTARRAATSSGGRRRPERCGATRATEASDPLGGAGGAVTGEPHRGEAPSERAITPTTSSTRPAVSGRAQRERSRCGRSETQRRGRLPRGQRCPSRRQGPGGRASVRGAVRSARVEDTSRAEGAREGSEAVERAGPRCPPNVRSTAATAKAKAGERTLKRCCPRRAHRARRATAEP